MDANTLFLRLEGPLQSWGELALGDYRSTAAIPTASALVGLLANALGWERERDEARLVALARALRCGVRIDRPGWRYTDYHLISTGLPDARGRLKKLYGRVLTGVTFREYLVGASFLAAVQFGSESTEDDLPSVAELAAAVERPARVLVLGRRSCLPSVPIFAGVGTFASLAEALATQSAPAARTRDETVPASVFVELAAEIETPTPGLYTARHADRLLSASARAFRPRWTERTRVRVPLAP